MLDQRQPGGENRSFFIGCASHRLNLGVKLVIEEYLPVIAAIQTVMVFLRTLKGRALLRNHTTLSPILNNATRWSSTKNMTERYIRLLPAIEKCAPVDVQLSPFQNRRVQEMLSCLNDLDLLTKALQDESLYMCAVRDYFDAAIDSFPLLERHCSLNSSIVVDSDFESAVVKILKAQQKGDDLILSCREQRDANHLLKKCDLILSAADSSIENDGAELSPFQEKLWQLKKRKVNSSSDQSEKYLDLRFLRPTSNICERMFSVAGFAFTKNRQGLIPTNLEMQLFLKANSKWWDISLLNENAE